MGAIVYYKGKRLPLDITKFISGLSRVAVFTPCSVLGNKYSPFTNGGFWAKMAMKSAGVTQW